MKTYKIYYQDRSFTVICDWFITTSKGTHEFHLNKSYGSEIEAIFPIEGTVI